MSTLPTVVRFEALHPVRVIAQAPVLHGLVWAVDIVAASPARDSDEYDELLDETFGSSNEWTDEVRFDSGSRGVRSLVLQVPEVPAPAGVADEWRETPLFVGGLEAESDEAFDVERADARSLTDDGALLVGARAERTTGARWRLAIAPDLALLFAGDRYMGWAVANPLVHLGPWGATRFAMAAGADTLAAVQGLHGLLAPPMIAALTNRDGEAMGRLRACAAAVEALPRSSQRDVLRARVCELLDIFGGR